MTSTYVAIPFVRANLKPIALLSLASRANMKISAEYLYSNKGDEYFLEVKWMSYEIMLTDQRDNRSEMIWEYWPRIALIPFGRSGC